MASDPACIQPLERDVAVPQNRCTTVPCGGADGAEALAAVAVGLQAAEVKPSQGDQPVGSKGLYKLGLIVVAVVKLG